MEERVNLAQANFRAYFESFTGLTEQQEKNFSIKFDHSLRVASNCNTIAQKMEWTEEERGLACMAGIFHDVGRFKQLLEYNTFNDAKSVDHAELALQEIEQQGFLADLDEEQQVPVLEAIRYHNKRELPRGLSENVLRYAQLLRDADKLDILKVISDYYSNSRATPILGGNLVSKENVANQMDIKIMQLSWVFDVNYKYSFQLLMEKRFLEKIYASLPKNDTVIQIYRRVKVFAENKIFG